MCIRDRDFNFSWGYMYGIFFCHFSSLLLLTRQSIRAVKDRASCGKRKLCLLLLQWMVYLCHLVCGLFYFRDVLVDGTYY